MQVKSAGCASTAGIPVTLVSRLLHSGIPYSVPILAMVTNGILMIRLIVGATGQTYRSYQSGNYKVA
jgi:hypothetical protein